MILAFINLIEAEGRSLRQAVTETATDLLLVLFAGILFTVGVLLVSWALYQYLLTFLGAAVSALIIGLLVSLIGGVILWRVRRKN